MSTPALSSLQSVASMLTAGVVALAVACAGPSAAGEKAEPDGSAAARPAASPAQPAVAPAAVVAPAPSQAASVGTSPATSAPAARNSPMQALNQMVTAQALLVSLLLAPLSKDAVEEPLARVDAPRPAQTR
jgi:hypothetical protein